VAAKPTRRTFNADQRRQAVEAFLKSGMPQKPFARLYGIAERSLWKWLKQYEAAGPKALEDKKRGRPKGSGGVLARIPDATKAAITAVKAKFPEFGLRKIRDFLFRFHAVKVSPGSVRKTLNEAGVSPNPPRAKKRRQPRLKKKPQKPFYRAKAMGMWQSDITMLQLARHRQTVYLVAFMDDFSRYVVSFGLGLRQTGDFVMTALLDGIARFGKPEEVLTDQGRQYFAWHGKSAFEKLLIREGIKHVVARSHHPQTVGKCERFWDTVKSEFWGRCHPQELADAKERLGHFIAHYNHFRPHQALGGMTPADRFFGAERGVREEIERKLAKDEIQLALEERPRQSVYVFAQVGEKHMSLHGEGGRIVIQTPEGDRREMALADLGISKEQSDGGHDGDEGGAGVWRGDGGGGACGDQAADAAVPQADEVPARTEDGVPGQGALGRGEPRGAGAGAPCLHDVPRAVAGENHEGGGDGAPAALAPSAVAVVPAGSGWDGGGAAPAAEEAGSQRGGDHAQRREGRASAPQAECGAREGGRGPQGDPGAPAGVAGEPGSERREGGASEAGGSGDGSPCGGDVVSRSERADPGGDENGADGSPPPFESGSGRSSGSLESGDVENEASQGRSG
jgi:transposase InsO family protein/transposase-like protein